MGAHASLTLGMFNAKGGLALERGEPADGGIHTGYRDDKGVLHLLPLFEGADSERARYVKEGHQAGLKQNIFREDEIQRDYLWSTDRFRAGQMELEVITPFFSIPDPKTASLESVKFASCPALFVNLKVSNPSTATWTAYFALHHPKTKWAAFENEGDGSIKGSVLRNEMALATLHPCAKGYTGFSLEDCISRQYSTQHFLLGATTGLEIDVPPGETVVLPMVIAFYRGGTASFGREMHYQYTRHFSDIREVLLYADSNREKYLDQAHRRDRELAEQHLDEEQKFLVAHATRSYYGSTEWLHDGQRDVWIVNEGEYLMMNTFDLTVDMLFYEMRTNPWTVRNVLEQFVANYSYYDQVFEPGKPDHFHPGGISFCHDMGAANQWSPASRSSYEVAGLDRECFSHMTCEQLTNWVLCAGVYWSQTRDRDFLDRHRGILLDCFESLKNRDHHDPAQRNGIMGMESSQTWPGGEITTYDSLDHSLGMSRNNIYLGGKMWASHVALEAMFSHLGMEEEAKEAQAMATLSSETLAAGYRDELGFIPAVLEEGNASAIVPAIEALIFPAQMGLEDATSPSGPYGNYISALHRHLDNILKPGMCLYDDGGWKLSSSADNSWMSKICLSQYVAESVMKSVDADQLKPSHLAHARWEREGSTFSACSDQFTAGVAKGSLYYPRIVTNILWLNGWSLARD